MDTMDQIKRDYELGLPVLTKIFELKKDKPIPLVKKVCQGVISEHYNHLFEPKNVRVTKKTVDDEVSEIRIEFYDALLISPMGIHLSPENGANKKIIAFNETFTLENLI